MDAPHERQDQKTTVEDVAERGKREAGKGLAKLKRKPALGVLLASGLGVLAASVIGVGEAAIAMAAGYAANRVLRT
jgi:hypothetical protein